MQAILKKNKIFIFTLIFFLLTCLVFLKQGNTIYNISVIMIVFLNLFLINFKKTKERFLFIFGKKINLFLLILLFIFFSKNLYSIKILISSILAFILFINFRNLEEKFKIKLIYFFSIFSIISYYLLCLLLITVPKFSGITYSDTSYIFNIDTISNINSYSFFNGINFHNLSLFYLGIFFLKLKFFRTCLNKFKNFFVISILLDFLFIMNLGYNSLKLMFLLMSLIIFLFSIINIKNSDKIVFFLIVLLSLNFFYLPIIFENFFLFDFLSSFEKLKNLINFLQLKVITLSDKLGKKQIIQNR